MAKDSPDAPTAPVPNLDVPGDDHDTALEAAVDFGDADMPRDTAPLDRAVLAELGALIDDDDDDGPATDEHDLSEFELDESISDDTLSDTVASPMVTGASDD